MVVIIAGGTGMVGSLVLNNCLRSDKIIEVRSLVRKPTEVKHPKLKETVIDNFEDYSKYMYLFQDINVAFFCIGVYTGQVPDEQSKKITLNYPVAFARALKDQSPDATFCLLSAAGSDSSEKSKSAFSRYKGIAENQLFKLNLKAYAFRPAYIYPVTPRKEPNVGYKILKVFYPLLKAFGLSIRSTDLASAMFNVGLTGAEKYVLENNDILKYVQ